jgi:asparagine synthase (glutamine-hydrolysing)
MGLLSEDVITSLQDYERSQLPWYQPNKYVPPGKQFHIFSVQQPYRSYGAFYSAKDPDRVTPFMSQPLVELCLRIPTYLLTCNGWDRAVERAAFAADLPQEIARRRSKGGQASFTSNLVKENLALARELLLEGSLVHRGLLARHKVEAALQDGPSGQVIGTARLSRCINIEVWLRLWNRHRLQLVA